MTDAKLTMTGVTSGVWHGVLEGPVSAEPNLRAEHLGKPLDGLNVSPDDQGRGWALTLPIPTELISDGVQTIAICDAESGETLASFSLIAGDPLADDLRAEIDLLRAELDMLKRAFRRHCLETM